MAHNVNVNVYQSKPINTNNNNVNVDKYQRAKMIDLMVDKLAKDLKTQEKSLNFLRKACWKLPEYQIWANLEVAMNGNNPMGLFIYLCKKSGV